MLIENKDKTGTGLSHFRLSFNQISPEPEPPVKKPAKPTKQARKPARKT